MKRFQHLQWCGALFVAGLLIPNYAHAVNIQSTESVLPTATSIGADSAAPSTAATRAGDVRLAQVEDVYAMPDASDTFGSDTANATARTTPRAEDLLPCPLSVPCRVVPDDEDTGSSRDVPPAVFEKTSIPRPAPARLLPCPRSVPCIATPDYPATLAPRPAARPRTVTPPRPATHVSSPVAPTRASVSRAPQPHLSDKRTNKRIRTAIVRRNIDVGGAVPEIKHIRPIDPKWNVTLEGTPALKQRAEQSLRESDEKLARIVPERLEGDAAVTYGQAGSLLNAGHNALNERDYLTAFGLGSKVSQLIATLPPESHAESSSHRKR